MRVLVTGSTGLIGSALAVRLRAAGHEVMRLVRTPPAAGSADVRWDPAAGSIDAARLQGVDAAVHLAGESIGGDRWTAARKRRIRDSRVQGTSLLASALARLAPPPRLLVSASAIGYYGERGEETLREESPPGTGFLAEVCRDWEAAADPARQAGIRVVHLRQGLVLCGTGGALARMLPPFRAGLGGRLGSGRQFMSWITLADLLGIIEHAMARDDLRGAVNAVSPQPATNREFTRTLGRVLSRPAFCAIPAFALRLALGEMAAPLLLASARVAPARLLDSGYVFQHADLESALSWALGPPSGARSPRQQGGIA